MYWSGIWMEYARCERIRSTVPRISAVPRSSSRDMQMSSVQKVPKTHHQSLTSIHGRFFYCTCSPNPRAAVHHDGRPPRVPRPRVAQRHHHGVLFPPHPLQELEHGLGGARDSVVGPRGELPVRDLPGLVGLEKKRGCW